MLTQTAVHSGLARQPAAMVRRPPSSAALPLFGSAELMGVTMPFGRNVEIYGENEPAEYLYKVISGSVRTYKILNDGRRQIGAFYLPGDIFGLESGEEHTFSAEAIVDSNILIIKRSAVVSLSIRNNEVARHLWRLTGEELKRVQDHIMLLVKTAQERVASFLLEMAARMSSEKMFELPMSRQDIADYLGLTIETVSRTLTQLENAATIELPSSRQVVLRNRAALGRLNG
jgi:CRP/FNR family transcriptional regulator, nitrogen fixation regulation protein